MKPASVFETDDGVRLPVDDRYLFVALSPTSPGTQYWEPPPPGPLTDRQRARILLQAHQLLYVLGTIGVDFSGKRLLDIGTGNGFIPRLLLDLTELAEAVGADPYLDGEHKTSWQPHDHDSELREIREFIDRAFGRRLHFEGYSAFLTHENFSMRPTPITLPERASKPYRFWQVGAHEVAQEPATYDIVYCKAIEHIPDWPGVFKAVSQVMARDGVLYFKHRPFFSYLGPHRYGSLNVPWGHVLLSDDEYRRFVRQFHAHRAEEMEEFFFRGLAYPRYSVPDMVRIAADHGFEPVLVISEPPRYLQQVLPFIRHVEGFWDIVRKRYPNVGADELLSGMYHIVFRRS
jgi:hypothetical protein